MPAPSPRGFARVCDKVENVDFPRYHVAVVGSGFGGSVAALRLAEKGYRVLVLEKGRRWQPGDFPVSNWNIPRSFWFPRFGCHGIWGLKLLHDVLVLHGVGVGGGSLVYANTLMEPPSGVWQDPGWGPLRERVRDILRHCPTVLRMLGAATNPQLGAADEALRRAAARREREGSFAPTRVGVFFGEPGVEVPDPYFGGEGPPRVGCTFCGACMTGCRVGAKNTLDRNYLFLAEKKGATIQAESEVVAVAPAPGGGYLLHWRRPGSARVGGVVAAERVVLAAGVLGTVKLLLECKRQGLLPALSPRVGFGVRTNNEALLGVTSRSRTDLWQGVAIGSVVQMDERTAMEPVRFAPGNDVLLLLGTLLTDGGPGAPRWLRWLGQVVRHPWRFVRVSKPWGKAASSVVLLAMQTEPSETRLVLKRGVLSFGRRTLTSEPVPGAPRVPSYLPLANQVARELAQELDAIPQSALNEVLLDVPTTAHILGGCTPAEDPDRGVVNASFEVFGYPGLYVLDGSVVGANLGVNPSLTIASLAEYAVSLWPPQAHKGPG